MNFGETQIFAWLDREIIPLRSDKVIKLDGVSMRAK